MTRKPHIYPNRQNIPINICLLRIVKVKPGTFVEFRAPP